MKYLFHGDNQSQSRLEMFQLVDKWKAAGDSVNYYDGLRITLPEIKNALLTTELFNTSNIVIENLLSRPISNIKKELLQVVSNYQGKKELIFWEKKEITKAQIKNLGNDLNQKLFKIPTVIFKFLDSVYPGNLQSSLSLHHQCLKVNEEGFIFIMLSRHLSELFIAKSGDTSKLIPFKRSGLISQANRFTKSQLLNFHTQLLSIDQKVKTGKTQLSYSCQLDLLLTTLLN